MVEQDTHLYSSDFFSYINSGSLASARVVCPIVQKWLAPGSLLDVGSGAGAWCSIWEQVGVSDVIGIDGDYVDTGRLLIDQSKFKAFDLSKPVDLGRRFDLVTSLEVAEHVAGSSADTFVENLVRHGDVILFSAAVPGQGGEFHVNEQPLDYWRTKFRAHDYRCFDPLRPLIRGNKQVEPWYRYNALLYVANDRVHLLPKEILATELERRAEIPEFAPASWRTRNAILASLPPFVVDGLVKIKHNWVRRRNGF